MPRLNVNINSVAAFRAMRNLRSPDPVHAAVIAEMAGCDGITVYVGPGREPIKKRDLYSLRDVVHTHLNVTSNPADDLIETVKEVKPDMITLVSDGSGIEPSAGVFGTETDHEDLTEIIADLQNNGILVSMTVKPEIESVKAAAKLKTDYVQLSTLDYSMAAAAGEVSAELEKISSSSALASRLYTGVSAGGGLNYRNISSVVEIEEVEEVIVGYAIIDRAIFVGLERAVREMADMVKKARIQ